MSHIEPQYFTGKFEGHEKRILFYQSWRPVFCEKIIVIIHGLGEHSGRYSEFAKYFSNIGYGVYAYDQRGHGRSNGQRGYLSSFQHLTGDLRCFLKLISIHEEAKPIFLFGHSLGGLVALRYAIECNNKMGVHPRGLIVANATLKIVVKIPKWKEVLSGFFARYIPRLSLHNELDLNFLSHDPKVMESVQNDTLCHQRITARFYHEILFTIDWVKKNGELLRIPTYLLAGGEDRIVDPKGTEEFFRILECEEKELKNYPTLYHELIHEVGKEEVFLDIKKWMEKYEKSKDARERRAS